MAAPGLDRLLSGGWYGTATTRLISIITGGWYDEEGVAVTAPFAIAMTASKPAISFVAKKPSVEIEAEKPSIKLVVK